MAMLTQDERPKAALRAIITFGKERDRWPDVDDLRRFRRRLGCRTTVQRTLRYLRDLGLVELRGYAVKARWMPTKDAFTLLNKPPFVPALELRISRDHARTLLADHPGRGIRTSTAGHPTTLAARAATALPVYE